MKRLLLLAFFIFSLTLPAQKLAQYDFETIKTGVLILAKQYCSQQKFHKAKILAKFLNGVDSNNADVKELIKALQEDSTVRVYTKITDEGLAFSKYLEGFTNSLAKEEYRETMSLITSVINPHSPIERNVKNKSFITSTNYYIDLFPNSSEVAKQDLRMTAKEASQKIFIKSMNYSPAEIVKAINHVNFLLRKTGVQIKFEIDFDNPESLKEFFSSQDESNGYIVYQAIEDKKAPKRVVPIRNLSVLDFLRYIEHTTGLRFEISNRESALIFREAIKGQNGIPEFVIPANTLKNRIMKNPVQAKEAYEGKNAQIIGIITRTIAKGDDYLIEINSFYVLTLSKKLLKNGSRQIIEAALASYKKNKDSDSLKSLVIAVRGNISITGKTRAQINDCTSVLATERANFYYTK